MQPIKKIKIDPRKAMEQHQTASTTAAVDRFAVAQAITSAQPHGLAPDLPPQEVKTVVAARDFNILEAKPGEIVKVPLHLIDVNPYSPRQFYRNDEIDKIAASLPEGQHDAAHGYIENGRVKLIDGGTRYRAAKISDTMSLDVKLEQAPTDTLDWYLRARNYNDQRSQPTPVDHALSLVRLIESGAVQSQKDLAEKVPDISGRPMSESQVSIYMRIGRMPERILRLMNEEPETSTTGVLYAVSEIFDGIDPNAMEDRIELAHQIVEEIKRRKLNKPQAVALVKTRLNGPKNRERSSVHPLQYAGGKGQIKLFARKGQLDMTMKGLKEEEMGQLKQKIVSLVETFMASRN